MPWFNLSGPEYIDLDSALDELEKIDKRKAQMVELCHLLGCTTQESAEMLQVSLATAERDLKFARGWLYNRLRPGLSEGEAAPRRKGAPLGSWRRKVVWGCCSIRASERRYLETHRRPAGHLPAGLNQ